MKQQREVFIRFGAVWGVPPGSHIGLWRVGGSNGRTVGLALRIGRRYRTCLTLLVHFISDSGDYTNECVNCAYDRSYHPAVCPVANAGPAMHFKGGVFKT